MGILIGLILMDASGKKSKPTYIYAEFATKPKDHTQGLMGRKHLSSNSGMLFDFKEERELSFWMANTYIPLQIAFITKNGRIGKISSLFPLNTRPVRSDGKYRYALEVNEGWFSKNGIQVGSQVQIPGMEEPQVPEIENPTQEQKISPDIVIQQSNTDLLKEISTYPSGFKIQIEYITKDGLELPIKTIETPFEFGDTADGESSGLLTAWDSQKARFSSFIVDNVVAIKDVLGNPITNARQIDDIFNKVPQTPRDEQSATGIMSR